MEARGKTLRKLQQRKMTSINSWMMLRWTREATTLSN